MSRSFLAAAVLLCAAAPAQAQFRADPGIVINGRVTVTVQATLFDLDSPYVPLARYRFFLVGPQRDTTTVLTNDAGVASVGLPAGSYRLRSDVPIAWKGVVYEWDVPVTVRPYMNAVELTPRNASVNRPAARTAGR